ncbi:MAG: FtsL-like putative cell division protein [Flavobacteriales bacterium]|jgi:hypothetical protein
MENRVTDKEEETPMDAISKKSKSLKKSSNTGNPLMQILNGEFLSKEFVVKNLGFIFYFIFLLILLVAKGYYDKKLTKSVDTSLNELDELTGDYVAKKAQLEEETKRITLVKELEPFGLKETENPTKVIRVDKED